MACQMGSERQLEVTGNLIQAELIESAVAGDRSALERLLLGYYDRLARRINQKLPAFLRGIVTEEDILQETFIEAFQRITSFEHRGERAFYRWVATIAEHKLLDIMKAQQAAKRGGNQRKIDRPARGQDNSVDVLIELLAGPQDTPSRSAARHEATAAIQVALAALSEDYRRAIQLRYFEGLSPATIAKMMNRTPHAVHNLCHRGLKELRVVLGTSSQFFTKK